MIEPIRFKGGTFATFQWHPQVLGAIFAEFILYETGMQ